MTTWLVWWLWQVPTPTPGAREMPASGNAGDFIFTLLTYGIFMVLALGLPIVAIKLFNPNFARNKERQKSDN
jgi:hypothetical protein